MVGYPAFLFALKLKRLYFWGLNNRQIMVFYVDLQPKDSPKCTFRQDVYAFLRDNGYRVISAAKPYSRVDTAAKTAVDSKSADAPPVITQRTSWSYFKNLINS